jgi:hypothetical protein
LDQFSWDEESQRQLAGPAMTAIDRPPAPGRASRTNPVAIGALACGIAQFGYLFYKPIWVIGIAAIILGHIARRRIRRTGERGYGLTKAALILGYGVLALGLLGTLLVLAVGGSGVKIVH